MKRGHRWRGRWHQPDCPDFGTPHWHVTCRDRGCNLWWIQPVLFDPGPWQVVA